MLMEKNNVLQKKKKEIKNKSKKVKKLNAFFILVFLLCASPPSNCCMLISEKIQNVSVLFCFQRQPWPRENTKTIIKKILQFDFVIPFILQIGERCVVLFYFYRRNKNKKLQRIFATHKMHLHTGLSRMYQTSRMCYFFFSIFFLSANNGNIVIHISPVWRKICQQ